MAQGQAAINRCPPGGSEGVLRLASITGRSPIALDESCGHEAPRQRAVIDEAWCIGCTLCIKACPVDCIVGASKQMHTVIESLCTGCELCLPVCPVDCIALVPASGDRTGWQAWSGEQATQARERFEFHGFRLEREERENEQRLAAQAQAKLADLAAHSTIKDAAVLAAKRAVIEAALRRASTPAKATAEGSDAA
jgi:electron transport complex protein RnfB